MKRTFTFIASCFVVASLSGQTGKAKIAGLGEMHHLKNTSVANSSFPYSVSPEKSGAMLNQRLDSIIKGSWDTFTNSWGLSGKEEYLYDSNGNILSDIQYSRFNSGSPWIRHTKEEFRYNASGKTTSHLSSYFDEASGNWIDSEQYSYSYNLDGLLVLSNNSQGGKDEYTYDAKRNLILSIHYTIRIGYVPKYKTEYSYDDMGNKTIEIKYHMGSTQWHVYSKREYTYDNINNLTSFNVFDWDSTQKLWKLGGRVEYEYDDNQNLIVETDYLWSYSDNQLIGFFRDEYTYDTNMKKTWKKLFSWDDSLKQWSISSKDEFTYNADGNISIHSHYAIKWDSKLWYLSEQSTYYYSVLNSVFTNQLSARQIRVFPNPAHDYIIFDSPDFPVSSTIEIFDFQGKKVIEQNLSQFNRISVVGLPQGLYIYQINHKGIIQSGKICIE